MVVIARLENAEDVYLGTTDNWMRFAGALAKDHHFDDIDFVEGEIGPQLAAELKPELLRVGIQSREMGKCKWNLVMALNKSIRSDTPLRFDVGNGTR